ncbi:hypothetical protein ACQQ9V_08785 [Hornefia butyriciproducens]|uniref:Uncharacterized protein n=1 Tax=Hornefia butyriciproducens TaxID=2652293 RepID=A0A6L5Y9I3_9FIRM|nr:hypothetical protein [Hornefia butyriciproducens]MDD7020570.1 hypothetical protein [Hornefia butyriciproducens]MST52577.1 hypothetical protein [Hornefia butyriciproducens]
MFLYRIPCITEHSVPVFCYENRYRFLLRNTDFEAIVGKQTMQRFAMTSFTISCYAEGRD